MPSSEPSENQSASQSQEAQKKIKKKTKAMFQPFLIEMAERTLQKLLEVNNKEAVMFKRTSKSVISTDHRPIKQRASYIGVSK